MNIEEIKKAYSGAYRSALHRRTTYLKAELKAMKSLKSKGIMLGGDNMIKAYSYILKHRKVR